MNKASETKQRLSKVLMSDRMNAEENFISAVNEDVYAVISDYFEPIDNSIKTDIILCASGLYDVSITFRAVRIKNVRIIK